MKEPIRIATGIEGERRRLTEAEAMVGGLPDRFTSREWRDMAHACLNGQHETAAFHALSGIVNVRNGTRTDQILTVFVAKLKRWLKLDG
jgi:hypothetical protein